MGYTELIRKSVDIENRPKTETKTEIGFLRFLKMEVFDFFPYTRWERKKNSVFHNRFSGFGCGFRSVFDVDNFRIRNGLRVRIRVVPNEHVFSVFLVNSCELM